MNADSYLTWLEARDGNFSNWFPVSYSILLKSLLKIWYHPGLMILVQLLATAAAVSYGVSKLTNSPKAHVAVPLAFLILPQAGISTILLGRDGLFCAVFIALSGLLLKYANKSTYAHRPVSLSICLLLLAILRWNGAVVGFFVIVLIWVLTRSLRHVWMPIIGLTLGLVILLSPPFSSNQGALGLRTGGQAIDIAYGLKVDQKSFRQNEIDLVNSLGGVEAWRLSQRDCMNAAMPLLNGVFGEGQY